MSDKRWLQLTIAIAMILVAVIGFFLKVGYTKVDKTIDRSISNAQQVEVLKKDITHIKERVDDIWKEVRRNENSRFRQR